MCHRYLRAILKKIFDVCAVVSFTTEDASIPAECASPAECKRGSQATFADCIVTHRPGGHETNPGADFRRGEQAMESIIAKLLQDFEQGKMNRRQLIQSLSVAAAAAAGMAPAAMAAGKPLEALYVNHISYQVNDYKKVRDFYVDLLGMKVTEDDGKQCRLVFGNNILVPRNRANGGPAKVDHIAYTVTNWDAEKDGFEAELKRRNLQFTGSAKTSFQVKDPEGMGVQFGGLHQ
jgi:catechol 2,3-dioxygenase-like lactoylglutathione lyase family enzyme